MRADEAEHSLEMQLPYVARCVRGPGSRNPGATIVPVMVGSLGPDADARFAAMPVTHVFAEHFQTRTQGPSAPQIRSQRLL